MRANLVSSDSELVLRVAAKGVIVNDEGQILILREAKTYADGTNTGRYHFPGGRLEPGESYRDGLTREIMEETGLAVEISQPLYVGEWRPVIRGVPHQIIAIFSVCKLVGGEVRLSEEHDHYTWIDPKAHAHYDLMDPEGEVVDALNSVLGLKN